MKIIIISEEEARSIQKKDMEQNSRKMVIEDILLRGINISDERFINYQKDYDNKLLEFELAKQDLMKKYNIHTRQWSLDYADCTLTIKE